jgi:hypothetical protein
MKEQQTGRGPSGMAVAVFVDGAGEEPLRGPLPGGSQTHDLVVGAATFSAGQRRWGAVALAVMAGIACLGLGGRWSELGRSARTADGVAVLGGGASSGVALRPTEQRIPVVAWSGGSRIELPVGFAIADEPRPSGGVRRVVVVGFVPGQQTVVIRLMDRDGAMVASQSIVGGSAKARMTLWSFQTPFEVPSGTRASGPDDNQIEVRWTDAAGAATTCTVAAAAGAMASGRCTTNLESPSQLEPSGRLRRTIP